MELSNKLDSIKYELNKYNIESYYYLIKHYLCISTPPCKNCQLNESDDILEESYCPELFEKYIDSR